MNIFGWNITKAQTAPIIQESLNRMSSVVISPWEQNRELYTAQNYQQLIEAYKSWVYVCASKNSNAVAAAPLRLYVGKQKKDTKILVKTKKLEKIVSDRLWKQGNLIPYHRKAVELEEVIEHPFLDMIKAVNPLINRFDLWDGTELWLELTGNAYWYVYKDNLGVPQEIWPLPPQFMQIVGSKEKIIAGYVYRKGTQKIPFESDEIVHFRFYNPTGSLYGTGPLSAVMDSYIDDKNIRTFESTLMQNMGRPEAVLQTTDPINDTDFKRIKARWKQNYGGTKKVGQTLILENGLKYTPITFTPREMNYVVGRKMNREEIAAAFGVPMSKLTTEDVNRSNASSGNWQYQNDTIEPRLRRIEETINEKLMPMYDENLFVAYDSTVPSDKAFELTERTAHLNSYVTTINEEREKIGLDKVEWGDIPLAPAGIGPLGSNQPLPGDGVSAAPAPGVLPGSDNNKVPPEESLLPPEKEIDAFVTKIVAKVKEKLAVR